MNSAERRFPAIVATNNKLVQSERGGSEQPGRNKWQPNEQVARAATRIDSRRVVERNKSILSIDRLRSRETKTVAHRSKLDANLAALKR